MNKMKIAILGVIVSATAAMSLADVIEVVEGDDKAIGKALNALAKSGDITKEGKGKDASYTKVEKNDTSDDEDFSDEDEGDEGGDSEDEDTDETEPEPRISLGQAANDMGVTPSSLRVMMKDYKKSKGLDTFKLTASTVEALKKELGL